MTLSITFSKPAKDCAERLGKPYIKVRVWRKADSGLSSAGLSAAGRENAGTSTDKAVYDAEFFTEKQAFRKTFTEKELAEFKEAHSGKTFRAVVERTDSEEITTMANRHGEIKVLHKARAAGEGALFAKKADRKKNYILKEMTPVPFLVKLGVMTESGKVIASKYDKFRQINRFLEYIDDVLSELPSFTPERPLRIADFGCGKSYLTFAVYYFLTELRHIPVEITGLDLKEDVIAHCQKLAEEFGYTSLHFYVGNIADFSYKNPPDMIITLHACDKATDYALDYAVKQGALAILSVPCCQHEINTELQENKSGMQNSSPFASLARWGIIRERFAALVTDAVRAELLEQAGYAVQMLEFIDMEHTPKNILIRAVKKAESKRPEAAQKAKEREKALLGALGVRQELDSLLGI